MNRRKYTRYLEVGLLLASTLATLVLAESAYRCWLFFRYQWNVAPSFYVYSKVNVQLDRDFGFSYIPNSDALYIDIVNGMPASLSDMRANALGNMGREPTSYDRAALKILVFGDSFTSIEHDDLTWTDILQTTLSAKLSERVSVINFGRDGYGTLQMFDLAAAQVARFKPDYVIFAFISDDLTRSRSWWMSNQDKTRLFRFETPPPKDADGQYAEEQGVDAALIDGRVTRTWFDELRRNPTGDDPLLQSLLARRKKLEKTEYAPPHGNVFSLTTFFLLNRIVYGHPYRWSSEPRKARSPLHFRLAYQDFAADARFKQDLMTLNSLGVPYSLVHFPIYDELRSGKYLLSDQERAVLQSLSRMTGKQPISLLDYPTSVDNYRKLFMLPDNHPSAQGLSYYARAVSEALIQTGIH